MSEFYSWSILPSLDDLDPAIPVERVSRALRKMQYEAVFERMLRGAGCADSSELIALLGIHRWEFLRSRRKLHIPAEWFLRLCFEHQLSFDWLLSGRGPIRKPTRARRGGRLEKRLLHILWHYEMLLSKTCTAACVDKRVREQCGNENTGDTGVIKSYIAAFIPCNGRYVALFPDLKVSTRGNTLEETFLRAKEALQFRIKGIQVCRDPLPEASDLDGARAKIARWSENYEEALPDGVEYRWVPCMVQCSGTVNGTVPLP